MIKILSSTQTFTFLDIKTVISHETEKQKNFLFDHPTIARKNFHFFFKTPESGLVRKKLLAHLSWFVWAIKNYWLDSVSAKFFTDFWDGRYFSRKEKNQLDSMHFYTSLHHVHRISKNLISSWISVLFLE